MGFIVVKSNEIINKVDEKDIQSSEMLSTIFKLNPDAITLTRVSDGKFIDCNQEFLNQVGYSRNEVIGHTSLELNLYSLKKRQDYLDEIRKEKFLHNFELKLRRKNGDFIYILYSARFITLGGEQIILNIGHDITKRKITEKALQESEERFHDLADNIPNLAWMADSSGWIFWYNTQWYDYTGTSLEEMQGWGWQKVHHPDYLESVTEDWSTKIKEGKPYDNIFPLKGKDGNYRWFLTRVTPIRDEQDKIQRWFGTNTDITELKQVEERNQKLLEKEQELTDELTTSNEGLQSTTEELQVTNEELLHQGDKLLKINKALEDSHEKLNKSLEELRTTETLLSSITNLSSEVIYIKDRQSRWIFANPALERIIGKTADELLGKTDLEIYSNPEIGKRILETDSRIMDSCKEETLEEVIETPEGLRTFISVKTPRFNENDQVLGIVGISHDITERKKTGEALERQAALLDVSYEAIFSWEFDGRILSWNKGAERLYGYNEKEAIGQISHDLLKTEFPIEFTEFKKLLAKEKIWIGELTHTPKDGQKIIVESRLQLIRDDSGKKIIIETNRDISQRKQDEAELNRYRGQLEKLVVERTAELEYSYESLKRSREHYLTLFNSIDEGFCTVEVIFDPNNKPIDYKFLEVNPAFENQTGLINASGKLMRDLAPDHEEYWFEIYGKVALTGKSIRFVNEAKALKRWYDVYAFKIGNSESHQVALLFNDITKFKKTEEALKLSNIYNRSLIEANLDPLLTIDPNGKITDVNSSTEIITGLNRDDLIGTDFSGYFTEPHKARAGYQKVFRKGILHDYELEIKHKNGHITPVLYNASVYRDDNDEIIGVFAAARDITERKKAEKELEFASKYNRSLIEASVDPLVTIGPDGKITDVNNSTESVTGYSREDLIDTDFSDYFTKPEKAREGYQQVYKNGTVMDYPLEIKHKNGHITPVLYNASVYRDDNDEVIGVFAAARDITELKKAEYKLKEYQDTLEEKVKKRTEELAKSNKELEQFAYITSHDLREPLRMITSFLQLLERRYTDQLDQDAKEFIGFAVDGAKRLDNMTNDLLSYSRITTKKEEINNVNFEKVLEEALINLKVPIEENNAVITHDPLPTIKGNEQIKGSTIPKPYRKRY